MILFIWIVVFAGMGIVFWALSLFIGPAQKTKMQPASRSKLNTKELPIIKTEDRASILEKELEAAKSTILRLQGECETAKNEKAKLVEDLIREKDWYKKDQQELEKVKQENAQIKEGLIHKEKELEKEFALNLSLNKGLKESKEQLEVLEKEKKQLLDEMPLLKAQITGLEKEIARLNAVIIQNQKKESESEWISKSEFNALKKQLQEKEEALRRLQAGQGEEKQSNGY